MHVLENNLFTRVKGTFPGIGFSTNAVKSGHLLTSISRSIIPDCIELIIPKICKWNKWTAFIDGFIESDIDEQIDINLYTLAHKE